MERFRQEQMKLDPLSRPGWRDTANHFRVRNKKYGPTQLKVPAVVQSQMANAGTSSALTTFGERMETIDSVPRKVLMQQVTSQPGSSHMWLGVRKPQTHKGSPSLPPDAAPDSSLIKN